MKYFSSIFLSLALLVFASIAHAQEEYYIVSLSAALSTETTTSTSAFIHTIAVNNSTITQAIFKSGTSGAARAADLAVAYQHNTGASQQGNGDIVVINTTNNNLVYILASAGTGSIVYGVEAISRLYYSPTETTTDFEFTLPLAISTVVQATNIVLKVNVGRTTGSYSSLFISFVGGSSTPSEGATLLQGTIRETGRVYTSAAASAIED